MPGPKAATSTRSARTPGSGPFHLLVAGAFFALTIPRMAQVGMFLDGLTYSSIARNLAQGVGTFWTPRYTTTVHPAFHEHLPLGLALEALPFALLGDHLFVERLWSLGLGAGTGVLLVPLWRTVGVQRLGDWAAPVFWLLPSVVTWSIVNNLLDVTQAFFSMLAVLAFVRSIRPASASARTGPILWAVGSGVATVAAVLAKGPVGLFPLAAPVAALLCLREPKRVVLSRGAWMALTGAAIFAVLVVFDTSRDGLRIYWTQQLGPSLAGARGGGGRQLMVEHLIVGVLTRMLALAALLWLFTGRRWTVPAESGGTSASRWGIFFLGLGLAASLPIALSPRIAGHYFLPSVSMYALAGAYLIVPRMEGVLNRWRTNPRARQGIGGVGATLLILAVGLPLTGVVVEPRDTAWVEDFEALAPSLRRGTTLATCELAREHWGLHAYMQRIFAISLDADLGAGAESGNPASEHFLALQDPGCLVPRACARVMEGTQVALYRCAVTPP